MGHREAPLTLRGRLVCFLRTARKDVLIIRSCSPCAPLYFHLRSRLLFHTQSCSHLSNALVPGLVPSSSPPMIPTIYKPIAQAYTTRSLIQPPGNIPALPRPTTPHSSLGIDILNSPRCCSTFFCHMFTAPPSQYPMSLETTRC